MERSITIDRYRVTFQPSGRIVEVEPETVLLDAAAKAGLDLVAPCGGQGRCGRCKVLVIDGNIEQPANAHLSGEDEAKGYVLACVAKVIGNAVVETPTREEALQRISTTRTKADKLAVAVSLKGQSDPTLRAYYVEIDPPSLADSTNDLDRLRRALLQQHGINRLSAGLSSVKAIARQLREADWKAAIIVEEELPSLAENATSLSGPCCRLVDIVPENGSVPLLGMAVDIGTTTVVVYLVDLKEGEIIDQASAFNAQLNWGEDIISRIIYSQRGNGLAQLQDAVVTTIVELMNDLSKRNGVDLAHVNQMVVAGNTTMVHLFLGLNPKYIREEPYIPTVTHPPSALAGEIGLNINPNAAVHCLPSVGAYVGGDITSGVLSARVHESEKLTIFIDVGTNGEIVLGNSDWLISCACSAGPAFEGAGVQDGMRAIAGAIDEIWVDGRTYEATYHVIGELPPKGVCGSGLIGGLADMFITGVIDKAGKLNRSLGTPRIREGEHGVEYVIVWAGQGAEKDIVITEVDINNLIRTKAAIYAGFSVLLRSVDLTFDDVEEFLIAGSFGQHINIEKAIQIGLLPDLAWDKFKYLGNTSVLGAYSSLVRRDQRQVADEIAAKMTYLELSADNSFHNEYMSSMFLPHTDIEAFPSVARLLNK